jgi:hypothetical protein
MNPMDVLEIGRKRSGPKVWCAELAAFARRAFADATPMALRQAWLDTPEPDFTAGSVRAGWRAESLLILAELEDADIFTKVTGPNQKAWLLGDTFEIFLRPIEQSAYVEFHVTPNNQHLQLRFPDADAAVRASQGGSIRSFMVPGEVFRSRTWLRPENRRWFVFAKIPAAVVCAQPKPLRGSRWQFSFSRYDYIRGRAEPLISSTSPHAEANFHRQQEWGVINFK